MRIRKNAKISPVLFPLSSANNVLETHSCQLNQSPWDVVIFPPAPSDSYPCEVDGEASFTGNGSLGDSIGTIESADSMRIFSEDEDNYVSMEEEERENKPIFCSKTVGEGNWECGSEAKEGHSLCEFHLAHLENYNNSGNPVSKKSAKLAKNRLAHWAKKSKSESNPYEIYYYSGFGPRWGKKRGAEKQAEPAKVVESEIEVAATTPPSSNSSRIISIEKFQYLEDDEDEEEEDDETIDGNRLKRGRKKRIKARSLKSLM